MCINGNCEFPDIHFGDGLPKLRSYFRYHWDQNETRKVEFFPKQYVKVTLIYTSNPNLLEKLQEYVDGNPISIDLEWSPDYIQSDHPVELFQFATSKGVIIVASDSVSDYGKITTFLETNTFFGKGTSTDKIRLKECCGQSFDIEDIEVTRCLPHNLPINFVLLTELMLGKGCAKFKDRCVSRSDWSQRPLSILQILYAAHDAYSMYLVYFKIIEKYGNQIVTKSPTKPSKKMIRKKSKTGNLTISFMSIKDKLQKISEIKQDLFICENEVPIKTRLYNYALKTRKIVSKDDEDEEKCFFQHSNDLIKFLMIPRPLDAKMHFIKQVQFTNDLLHMGLVRRIPGRFACLPCDKHFNDFLSLVQHSFDRHAPEAEFPDISLNLQNLLMQNLSALSIINCPITFNFSDVDIRNKLFLPEENDDDGDNDDNDDNDEYHRFFGDCREFVPLVFNEGDEIKCNKCNLVFQDVECLKLHCWGNHFDMFLKLFGIDEEVHPERNDIISDFGVFCINKLKLADVEGNPQVAKCKRCDFKCAQPDKFFNHLYFKHGGFALVSREEYVMWPMRFEKLPHLLKTNLVDAIKSLPFDEMEKNGIYCKDECKCINCGMMLTKEKNEIEHFIQNHLIFIPSILE